MAILRPFPAVRPANELADKALSLPYDVMNRKEAAEMAKGNPHSFLHICRSEIDMPEVENPYTVEVYEKAKNNIKEFIEKGTFKKDEKPMLYIYKQTMNGNVQTGIVGCFAIDEYQKNVIKKHEFTRVEKELDRINHFDVCNTNTEPVFLTYRKKDEVNKIVETFIEKNKAEFDFTSGDGVGHALWKIDDESVISKLVNLFADIDSLYIADGHHRSASAVKVGLKRREENPGYSGNEEFNYFMAVVFPDEDLKIFDYNRVVKDLNGHTEDEFLKKVSEKFDIENKGKSPYTPESKHTFGMLLNDSWYKLTAKEAFIQKNDVIKSLDVSILQDELLAPILGIGDPRTDKRIDFVGGIRGLEGLEARVSTDMKVAFALHAVAIEDLLKVSDMGMVMPPKSTWFEPKLGSGLFMHQLY